MAGTALDQPAREARPQRAMAAGNQISAVITQVGCRLRDSTALKPGRPITASSQNKIALFVLTRFGMSQDRGRIVYLIARVLAVAQIKTSATQLGMLQSNDLREPPDCRLIGAWRPL